MLARNADAPSSTTREEFATRTWLVIGGGGDLTRAVASSLEAAGARTQMFTDVESSSRAIADLLASATGDVEIVHLSNTEATVGASAGAELTRRLSGVAHLVRAVNDVKRSTATRVWLVTSGAQAVGSDEESDRWQAPTWGLGRVIALEHPDTWGGLIDLDPHTDTRTQANTLIEAIVSSDVEDQIAIRRAVRYAPRIARSRLGAAGEFSLRSDGAYLITGGTGGIAVQLVAWAAERGARHVVLTSRRGLPARVAWSTIASEDPSSRLIAAILDAEKRGVTVDVVACDVASREAMTSLIGTFGTARPRLRGVFHAAAAMSGSAVRDLDANALASMLAPKVDGTCVIEELTRALELDFVVLFSSTTALLGVAGLGHYAAANLFLDASARSRASGRHVLSVNWGTWEEMRLASESERRSFSQAGQQPMRSKDALARLERLLAAGASNKIVAAIDWAVLKPVYEARRVRPIFGEVGPVAAMGTETPQTVGERRAEDGIVERLRRLPTAQREQQLTAYLQDAVAAVLGLPASQPAPVGRGLFEMGMDSLMSVELKNRLEFGLQHRLPSTLTFNYPNITALTAFLLRELALGSTDASLQQAELSPAVSTVPVVTDDAVTQDMSEDELASLLSARLGEIR
jgi:myxalamid-type polyketide synthase MxaE and MxaD